MYRILLTKERWATQVRANLTLAQKVQQEMQPLVCR